MTLIRIPLVSLEWIDPPVKKDDGYIAVIKKSPVIFKEFSGIRHVITYKTNFLVQGGYFIYPGNVPEEVRKRHILLYDEFLGYRKLPYGDICLARRGSWGTIRTLASGYGVFLLEDGMAKPTNQSNYDATLFVFRCGFHSRVGRAGIKVLSTKDASVLFNDSTATAVDTRAMMVVMIMKGGRVDISYTSYAPYSGLEEWSNASIVDVDGTIKIEKIEKLTDTSMKDVI
ncbi:MAG: hypothetical protein QXI12_04185 [Candidatus Methanomethyliaceae archaeon]